MTSHSHKRTAKGITITTNEVKHGTIGDNVKCASEIMKYDREYIIDHAVHHVCKGANMPCVIRWYDYTAADGTIDLIANILLLLIPRYR